MIKIIEIWDIDKPKEKELNTLLAEGWEIINSGMSLTAHECGSTDSIIHWFHLIKR